jgi:hypothetical protein
MSTTTATGVESTSTTDVGRHTTHFERGALAVLVTVVTAGLAVDTRSHRESDRIDTFFTQAHALGYAAATACAIFLLWTVRRRQQAGPRGTRAIPLGFESAVWGLGVYVLGGVGDLIWHTVFGVEQELKILFSPSHLLLMCAMLMLAFGAARGAWMVQADPPHSLRGLRHLWPVFLGAGSIATVLNIFMTYASPYETGIFTVEVPILLRQFSEFLHIAASMGLLLHTIAWFGCLLLLMRRWPLPLGAITLLFSVPAAAMFIYFDYRYTRTITALVVGAVVLDAVNVTFIKLIAAPRVRFRVFAALAPAVFWSAYLLITKEGAITWTNEQWTGTILLSSIVGLGISVLLLPPRITQPTYLD